MINFAAKKSKTENMNQQHTLHIALQNTIILSLRLSKMSGSDGVLM